MNDRTRHKVQRELGHREILAYACLVVASGDGEKTLSATALNTTIKHLDKGRPLSVWQIRSTRQALQDWSLITRQGRAYSVTQFRHLPVELQKRVRGMMYTHSGLNLTQIAHLPYLGESDQIYDEQLIELAESAVTGSD